MKQVVFQKLFNCYSQIQKVLICLTFCFHAKRSGMETWKTEKNRKNP